MAIDDEVQDTEIDLAEQLGYDSQGGKCCGTCKNAATKEIWKGDHFSARDFHRIPWCYKVERMISDVGYCKAYTP